MPILDNHYQYNKYIKPTALHHQTTTSSVYTLYVIVYMVCICAYGGMTLGGYLWRRAAARGASSRRGRVVGRRLLLDHPRTHPSCPPFRPTGMGGCPCERGAAETGDLRCGRRMEGRLRPPDVSVPDPSYWPRKSNRIR